MPRKCTSGSLTQVACILLCVNCVVNSFASAQSRIFYVANDVRFVFTFVRVLRGKYFRHSETKSHMMFHGKCSGAIGKKIHCFKTRPRRHKKKLLAIDSRVRAARVTR